MSETLLLALKGVQGQSFGSGHWHIAPGPGPGPLPDMTGPRAELSAKPVKETENGPASPSGSTDPAPGKQPQRRLVLLIFRITL